MILRWLSSHPSEPRLSLQAAGIAPAPAPVAEETTAPRSDPIDFQVLADILGDSDRAFLTELLKGFEDSYVSLWAGMADALANNDLTALREISHSAKGAAANAGATILSDLLKDLETAAKEGDGPTARSLWPRVEAESKATLSFINAL
ncbi:MAG: Hpt domain-containing protein [Alphaproteobacteria bacterium]|nr:Hpt domain-containing protein [Alphaproteobacteria bacterium]